MGRGLYTGMVALVAVAMALVCPAGLDAHQAARVRTLHVVQQLAGSTDAVDSMHGEQAVRQGACGPRGSVPFDAVSSQLDEAETDSEVTALAVNFATPTVAPGRWVGGCAHATNATLPTQFAIGWSLPRGPPHV